MSELGKFDKVMFPTVRACSSLLTADLVSVQPMAEPLPQSDITFRMRFPNKFEPTGPIEALVAAASRHHGSERAKAGLPCEWEVSVAHGGSPLGTKMCSGRADFQDASGKRLCADHAQHLARRFRAEMRPILLPCVDGPDSWIEERWLLEPVVTLSDDTRRELAEEWLASFLRSCPEMADDPTLLTSRYYVAFKTFLAASEDGDSLQPFDGFPFLPVLAGRAGYAITRGGKLVSIQVTVMS